VIEHSQFGEGAFLIKYFDEIPPRYRLLVDVGAFGVELSNTYDLIACCGWGGLLIEPMPIEVFWDPLKEAMKERKDIKILNVAISDSRGVASGYIHEIPGHNSLIFEQESHERKEIVTRTLPDVLKEERIPNDFDLLSVDTEGLDYLIIRNLLEESDYRPRVIVVEREKPLWEHYQFEPVKNEETVEYGRIFGKFGYTQVFETHGNRIFAKEVVKMKTAKMRVFKNETKITQVFYDRHHNPHEVKPGATFVEDLSGVVDLNELIKKDKDRRALQDNVDEARRVKRALALINATKKVEDLDKFKDGEKNQDVLDAILLKEKELLDVSVNGESEG
jgi:FkbM family methyltransferase